MLKLGHPVKQAKKNRKAVRKVLPFVTHIFQNLQYPLEPNIFSNESQICSTHDQEFRVLII